MKILSLDPATKCGWALSNSLSGTWDLSVKQDESSGARYLRLWNYLDELHQSNGIDLIVFEASRNPKHSRAVVILARIQGTIELWATQNDVEYQPVSPMTIKVFATGNNKASKAEMISAAKKYTGRRKIIDDNHADAVLLLELAKEKYGNIPISDLKKVLISNKIESAMKERHKQ